MVVHACNPAVLKPEVGGSLEFETSLSNTARPCLKKKKKKKVN
jgi:hypothetical protein